MTFIHRAPKRRVPGNKGLIMPEEQTHPTILDATLSYLARGWSVIPVATDKKPLIEWKRYQSVHPTEADIRQWFTTFPNANIAVITGEISGIFVVDIDPRHGGSRDLLLGYETITAATGGGGWHYYFKYQKGFSNAAGVDDGIDIRGDGGYVIAPPSIHTSGGKYT